MPISPIVLQCRHAELGRIRLGAKQGGKGRPMKLETFRFTSVSERHIRDLAELYGGTPQPWDNNGIASWEVFTDANTIPVVAVKGGLSQWMETWSGGGVTHRCDGVHDVLTDTDCNPDDPAHVQAKPTTRLSVMLPELDAIGVWRMESHGWNAAAEIPAVAELAQFVGDLVPANLHLIERRAIKDGKTSRFVVPVLDLQIGTARLREIVAAKSGAAEIEAPARSSAPALEAPKSAAPAGPVDNPEAYAMAMNAVAHATSLDVLSNLWGALVEAGLAGERAAPTASAVAFVEAFKARAAEIKAAAPAPAAEQPAPPVPDAEGIVDTDLVDDEQPTLPQPTPAEPDPDVVWQQILKAASDIRGWGLAELTSDFKTAMGMIPDEASGPELASYLHLLQTGEAA